MIIIIMGVSGCGKTTVGELLAEATGGEFFDGDNFHSKENVEKMRSGNPLDDKDRKGWLLTLNRFLRERSEDSNHTFLACSALKESYRETLNAGITPPPKLVFLKGSFELIWNRMEARQDHYMPASLLRSQFETLEEPMEALTLEITDSPQTIAGDIQQKFQLDGQNP